MSKHLPSTEKKRSYVQSMFTRIASHYDLMNRFISFGQDTLWRKWAVEKLSPHEGQLYLDIGAGTGDISLQIIQSKPGVRVIAADLTIGMLEQGKKEKDYPDIYWVVADVQALPFKKDTFKGVISGYLLRNVSDVRTSLQEQVRVIHPGAHLVCLDTTPPEKNLLFPFINFYLRVVIPIVGWLISGDWQAYSYLPESTRQHIPANILADRLKEAGLLDVVFEKHMSGTMAIHSGTKEPDNP